MKRLIHALLFAAACAGAQTPAGTWKPPTENDAVPMDSSKGLPFDITGIRLGMPMAEAAAIVQKLNPRHLWTHCAMALNANQLFVDTLRVADSRIVTDTYVSLTLPPATALVWRVFRTLQQSNT